MSKSFTGQFQENMAKMMVQASKNPLMQMGQKMKADFGKRALSTAALSAILMNSFAGQAQAAWTDFLPSMETMSAAVKGAAGYASDAASAAWSMAPSKETLGAAASTIFDAAKDHPYVAGGTAAAVGLPLAYMLYQYWGAKSTQKSDAGVTATETPSSLVANGVDGSSSSGSKASKLARSSSAGDLTDSSGASSSSKMSATDRRALEDVVESIMRTNQVTPQLRNYAAYYKNDVLAQAAVEKIASFGLDRSAIDALISVVNSRGTQNAPGALAFEKLFKIAGIGDERSDTADRKALRQMVRDYCASKQGQAPQAPAQPMPVPAAKKVVKPVAVQTFGGDGAGPSSAAQAMQPMPKPKKIARGGGAVPVETFEVGKQGNAKIPTAAPVTDAEEISTLCTQATSGDASQAKSAVERLINFGLNRAAVQALMDVVELRGSNDFGALKALKDLTSMDESSLTKADRDLLASVKLFSSMREVVSSKQAGAKSATKIQRPPSPEAALLAERIVAGALVAKKGAGGGAKTSATPSSAPAAKNGAGGGEPSATVVAEAKKAKKLTYLEKNKPKGPAGKKTPTRKPLADRKAEAAAREAAAKAAADTSDGADVIATSANPPAPPSGVVTAKNGAGGGASAKKPPAGAAATPFGAGFDPAAARAALKKGGGGAKPDKGK